MPHWPPDRKSTRLNSSHANISYAVFCLKKKKYSTRLETLEEHAALDVNLLHLEDVDVGAVVVLCIRDRRLEQLAQDRRALLRRERQDVDRLVDGLAADQIGDQTPLLGGKPRTAQAGFSLRHFLPAGAGAA